MNRADIPRTVSPSPINGKIHQWKQELKNLYDPTFIEAFANGHANGFDALYRGPNQNIQCRNGDTNDHHHFIAKYLASEVGANRMLGPFHQPPFTPFRASPIFVIPKKYTTPPKWRLIFHLSAPEGRSFNDGIDTEQLKFSLETIDDAIQMLARHNKPAYMFKFDIEAAYRLVPLNPTFWNQLGFQFENGFFVDTHASFGSASSPWLFVTYVAKPLTITLQRNYGFDDLLNYIDDFLSISWDLPTAEHRHSSARQVCNKLGIPLADDKYSEISSIIIFLGIELDTIKREARLPTARLKILQEVLAGFQPSSKVSRTDLDSLLGHLSHAAKVVKWGRTFCQRLRELRKSMKNQDSHIKLSVDAQRDIAWWQRYASTWNGKVPFPSLTDAVPLDLKLASDASGTIGFGAVYNSHWFSAPWSDPRVPAAIQKSHDINAKELFAVACTLNTFGHLLENKKVRLACDNNVSVQVFYAQRANTRLLNSILRSIFFTCQQQNIDLTVHHVPGKANTVADALSRQHWNTFRSLLPSADLHPTPLSIEPLDVC